MEIQNIKLTDIKPYPHNPRNNDAAVDKVAASIKEFGFNSPIVCDKDFVVICGHTRLKAAQKLELETAPVLVAEHLTPEQVNAYRIADNKTGEIAEWNEGLLISEILNLQEAQFDLSLLGFDDEELDSLLNSEDPTSSGMTDPDEAPEIPEIPDSFPGQAYQLGEHILFCGDATKAEDVSKIADEGSIDLWLTDPPYNVNYEGSDGKTILNDAMEDKTFRDFLRRAFLNVADVLKAGAPIYIFHADSEGYNFRGALHEVGIKVRECLIWKKNALVLGRQDYQWVHEPCLYAWKEGAAHPWYSDRSQTTVMEFNKPKKNDVHPTMKPTEMLVYLIKNSSKRGDIVIDTFGGSGSTLIACEQTGRICRTMELDPRYCDVIRRRWAEFVHGEGCDWKALTPKLTTNKESEK